MVSTERWPWRPNGIRSVLVYGPVTYRELSEHRLGSYLASLPEIAARLGSRPQLWQIQKIAGSELSTVFVAKGPAGEICVKQAIACTLDLGGPWPLPLERTVYEEAALTLYARFASGLVPRVLHFDSEQALLILERLHPHITLRRGLIKAQVYPRFAEQIGRFLGETLFRTSDLAMTAAEKKERIAFFCGNAETGRLAEHLTFTEPYLEAPQNRWTKPELDDLVREIREDDALKRAISALKQSFMAEPQALAHGNLHTGSVLVTETDTKVIDPVCAFFGPIGFDLGTLFGHLLIAYFSQRGHAPGHTSRKSYERWLAGTVEQVWQSFHDRFLGLWRSAHTGDAYPEALFAGASGSESLGIAQKEYMRQVFEEALRFAGTTIIRATLGRHPAPDFEQIDDRHRRAACERAAVLLARELIKDAQYVSDTAEVMEVARQLRDGTMAAG
jgi:5-methylthioribose kinase